MYDFQSKSQTKAKEECELADPNVNKNNHKEIAPRQIAVPLTEVKTMIDNTH